MDLRNLETTTTYAIEAVYREYWNLIPERYKLLEKAKRQDDAVYPEHVYEDGLEQPHFRKPSPHALKYSDVEKIERHHEEQLNEYDEYCKRMLNKEKFFDLSPFYDPELTFENRLHYKLVGVNYPDRKGPWFVISWNIGNGLLRSSISRRLFQTTTITTPAGDAVTLDFINTELDLTLGIYSNSMQALFELQENIIVGKREKATVDTQVHSILGKFPVSLNIIDSTVSKLQRDKGTLCVLMLNIKVDFPIIGNVKPAAVGIIKEIHTEIDEYYGDPHDVTVLSRDIIDENTKV